MTLSERCPICRNAGETGWLSFKGSLHWTKHPAPFVNPDLFQLFSHWWTSKRLSGPISSLESMAAIRCLACGIIYCSLQTELGTELATEHERRCAACSSQLGQGHLSFDGALTWSSVKINFLSYYQYYFRSTTIAGSKVLSSINSAPAKYCPTCKYFIVDQVQDPFTEWYRFLRWFG